MRTIAIEFTEWRGFRIEGGLFPVVCAGWVTVWWCRGSVLNQLAHLRCTLADAARELKAR